MIDKRNIDELRSDLARLAEKATPGDWWIDSHGSAMVAFNGDGMEFVFKTDDNFGVLQRHEDTGNLSRWANDYDATFIATASPKNILRILGELDSRVSTSNAWYHIDNFLKTGLSPYFSLMREEVSADLYRDGCASSAIHVTQFITALMYKIEELKEELETK